MKLESLKKFQENSINEIEMNNVFGGLADSSGKWISTKKDPYTNSDGCTVNTTDSYYDANGNGKHDSNESYSICASVDCGVN